GRGASDASPPAARSLPRCSPRRADREPPSAAGTPAPTSGRFFLLGSRHRAARAPEQRARGRTITRTRKAGARVALAVPTALHPQPSLVELEVDALHGPPGHGLTVDDARLELPFENRAHRFAIEQTRRL